MNRLLAVLILSCFSLVSFAAETQQSKTPPTRHRVPAPVAEPASAPKPVKTPAPITEKETTKPRVPGPVAEPASAPKPAPTKTEKKAPATQKKVNSQK